MGSFDRVEICELVELYIQLKLEKILPKSNFGLYWDDGLALFRSLNGQQTDKARKNTIWVFKDIGFSLETENSRLSRRFTYFAKWNLLSIQKAKR